MNFLKGIKNALGERRLKGRSEVQRYAAVTNFERARSVAVIYQEKGEGFYILVKQYVKYLKAEMGIREVLAMAYIDNHKEVPHYHLHRLRYDYFTNKELDFFMEPAGEQVQNFIKRDFDILIDLEKETPLPLRYVMQASKARFKVGYHSQENEYLYDLMIRTGNQTTFDEYIKQVNHYLKTIDSHDARA
jgi:hypothetical protein